MTTAAIESWYERPGALMFYSSRHEAPWLSNFELAPITLHGKVWPTTEHYFQAAKFLETDPVWAEAIRATATPASSKTMGRSRAHPILADWETVKDDIMRECVTAKFAQHANLAALLVATGDRPLVEASPTDFVWGAGRTGRGQNRLGVILMNVRGTHLATITPVIHAEPPKVSVRRRSTKKPTQ